jgi:rhodanese-related sulfurtransferase
LPGIAALHTLFELLLDKQQAVFHDHATLSSYREQLLSTLRRVFPTLELNHDLTLSVPTTLNFSVRGVPSRDIMDVFDAANIRVSSGSACSSKVPRSFVLDAMGLAPWRSQSAIRLSFGPATSQATISAACERIQHAASALRHSCLLLADTNEDIDSDLDGVVQLRFDNRCCYLIIDQAARQLVVIDPLPELAERIERLVQCQHYRVRAVLTTEPHDQKSPAAMLAQLLCASGCGAARDAVGWPLEIPTQCPAPIDCTVPVHGCLSIGDRRLFRVGSRQPVYLLSSPLPNSSADQLRVDFAFIGEQDNPAVIAPMVHPHSLLCSSIDDDFSLVRLPRELAGGGVDCSANDVIAEADTHWLEGTNTLVIDVREQQEHAVTPLPVRAEVINVPLTRLAQFIYSHGAELSARPILCICRSGQRSAVAARVLQRHGFTQVRQLIGGLTLLAN